jgi:hypothetical protein
MEALEVAMEKHNINLDSSSPNSSSPNSSSPNSSSHGHALSTFSFCFTTTYTSLGEWLIDFGASYHMAKDKAIFDALN